ncbi:MAG: hypothetical protein GH155_03840 [Spirochaeta sp.]|nr:hypothetical protein [Spirochaeta sp.]
MGKTTDIGKSRPWQAAVLAWLSIAVALLALIISLLVIKLAYEGFAAGEMGTMIGIFGAAILIFLLPLLVLSAVITIGNFKGKKWSLILSLIFTGLGFPAAFFTLAIGPAVFLAVILFLGLMLWVEIICLKHPYYHQKKT